MSRRAIVAIASIAAVFVLVPLAVLWSASLVPDRYSVMDMGYPDYGGGRGDEAGHGHGSAHLARVSRSTGGVSVVDLTGPRHRAPDVSKTLVAREGTVTLASGQRCSGYTLNGSSPGPEIRARQGDLVEVRLVNRDVSDGVTLHWHGVDVPNAEDGVAGVTQNAVRPGGEHVYRFVVKDAGTYWYHSHQMSHEQVIGGLFGTIVVEPRGSAGDADLDVVAPVHTYDAYRTVAGRVGTYRVNAPPGTTVRVRVVDTDNGPLRSWVDGARYRVLAVDGTDVHAPTPVDHRAVLVPAGGRADIGFTTPRDGSAVRVGLGGDTAVVVGPKGAPAPHWSEPSHELDLLGYGSPAAPGFDPAHADRHFEYTIGRRPGFIDGRPGVFWSVNGHLFPDVPMFMVDRGDVVVMTIRNRSGEVHPMHLHGHHGVVLSRDGVAATGSPWWFDSLDVATGESYRIAFVADNPGVWMDHCHNLPHVAEGLVAHLAYTGVNDPYRIGGTDHNTPE